MTRKFSFSRATILALVAVFCLGLLQFSLAEVETITEPEPRDLTADDYQDHSIHIEFCVSWGSKRNFLQVREWLEYNFPELRGKVSGGNYPVPPIIELLLNILSMIQIAAMGVALMGDNVFRLIGMRQTPRWYEEVVTKNVVPIMVGIFLIAPTVLNGYVVSGAFEIVLDGNQVIFSKIASGRMPNVDDLLAPLTKAGLTAIQS